MGKRRSASSPARYQRTRVVTANRWRRSCKRGPCIDAGALAELDGFRQQILNLDISDVGAGLTAAKQIRGLGTAGASGLLSLMYPERFATVDQFVVKALRQINELPESAALSMMDPLNLSVTDGVILIGILSRKARDNNRLFGTMNWTPRKIDMVLWTYGR